MTVWACKKKAGTTGDGSFLQMGTAVDAELMPSGVILQNKRENLPRVCHALAFLGMARCQDLFLVRLQGWKLGTRFQDGPCSCPQEGGGSPQRKQGMPVRIHFLFKSFLSRPITFAFISLARTVSLATAIGKIV
ncbi:PREDICTED: protein TMEM155 isoform X2 [Cercocebus atys]|uniref:protein TMEM155 isoform X2 n=1 Tax=Cercocebus atys TaxID=9531 RepID=UPI0005F3775D|nr:PREDICTED: protein TMEM155 isoform X2 [Cercocebus atys]